MHRVLAPSDYQRVAWKNGGGLTTEIACEPPDAGLDEFNWRVSVADVESDGPFSMFPGVDRTLVMLRGEGMRLTGDARVHELRSVYDPIVFAGELPLVCTLLAGPVRDYNLMVRRSHWAGAVEVVQDASAVLAPALIYVLYAAAGACECLFAGHAPVKVAAEHAMLLRADDMRRMEGVQIFPLSAQSASVVAIINPAPGVPAESLRVGLQ